MDRRAVIAGLAGSFLPAAAFAAPVSLSFRSARGRVFFPVRLGGVATWAMLDTAANASFIDTALAEAIGAEGGPVTATGAGGLDVPSQLHSGLDLEIGGEPVSGLTFVGVDLSGAIGGFSEPVGLVAGASLMRRFVVAVDYETLRLTFTPSAEFAAPRRAMRLDLDASLPFLPITIEGGRRIRANLDLGLDEAMTVNADTAIRLRLLEGRPVSEGVRTSIEGSEVVWRTSARRVAFAGHALRNLPLSIWAVDRREAAIGAPVLSRFHLTYDLSNARLWLRPNRDFGRPFARDVFGWADDEEGRVTHVFPGGPAEKAGLRVGDRVIANDNPRVLRAPEPPVGERLGLTLEDGRQLVLVTAEYY